MLAQLLTLWHSRAHCAFVVLTFTAIIYVHNDMNDMLVHMVHSSVFVGGFAMPVA